MSSTVEFVEIPGDLYEHLLHAVMIELECAADDLAIGAADACQQERMTDLRGAFRRIETAVRAYSEFWGVSAGGYSADVAVSAAKLAHADVCSRFSDDSHDLDEAEALVQRARRIEAFIAELDA